MRQLRAYNKSLFLVFLFIVLCILYELKKFSFPVHESFFFIIATESFHSSITNFWHPPLYVMLLFSFRQVFHDPFIAAQVIGLISVYLTSLFIFIIIERLELKYNLNSTMKYLLSLINIIYVPIYNSIFLFDIDNTILVPFLLFFVDYFISNVRNEKKWQLLSLLVLLFWIKEVVFVPVAVFMFIVYFMEYGHMQGIKKVLPVILMSLVINLISYGLYSHYFIGNWGSIAFNGSKLLTLNHAYPSTLRALSLIGKAESIVLWGGTYLFVLLLVNTRGIYSNAYTKYVGIFIILYLVAFTIPWPAESGGWPKYAIPIYPFMLIISSFLIKEYDFRKFAGYIILFSLIYYMLGDYLYKIYNMAQLKEVNYSYLATGAFWYLVIPMALIIFSRYLKLSITLIIFILFLSQDIGLLTNQIYADYSTNYQYGTYGTDKVFKYIQDNKIESITTFPIYDQLFKRKDNMEAATYYINRDIFFIRNMPKSTLDSEILKKIHNNEYRKVYQIGSYQIWKRMR